MKRPNKFEHFRYIGDKRNLTVYDVDSLTDEAIIEDLMQAGTYISFGPDTAVEARNRGYRLYDGPGSV